MARKTQLTEQNAVRNDEPDTGGGLLDLAPPEPPPEAPPAEAPPADAVQAPPDAPPPEPPLEAPTDVVVATSAGMPRPRRYRVLNSGPVTFWWQANPICFCPGDEFDESTHSPRAMDAFIANGLVIEQTE